MRVLQLVDAGNWFPAEQLALRLLKHDPRNLNLLKALGVITRKRARLDESNSNLRRLAPQSNLAIVDSPWSRRHVQLRAGDRAEQGSQSR